MNSFTMTRTNAQRLAQVALSAASKDDTTPVICGALLTITGESVRTTSTDRYRVHTALVDLEGKAKDHEFIMPRSALEWLAKNVGTFGRFMTHMQRVTITTDDTALTVVVRKSEDADSESVSWNGRVTTGNFPPVMTLIEKARTAEAMPTEAFLKLDWLSKANVLGHMGDSPRIKFTASDRPDKPGPVLITFGRDGIHYAEAIVQPALNLV